MLVSGPAASKARAVWLLPTLASLLFLSGISALIYQVVWLRLLSLTFGVTVHAASTVLAAFMGGLALGSYLAGRFADRSKHPLRLFGFVELQVGLCGVIAPAALGGVHALYVALASRMPESPVIMGIVRFLLPSMVLIVPTALMGATLPLVVRSSLTRLEGLGTRVGLLYASNTAGAIAGALLAGFYLIPQAGLRRSSLLAAAANAFVGITATTMSLLRERAAVIAPAEPGHEGVSTAEPELPSAVRKLVLMVFAVSGFASLALEVVWFRVLVIFLGPTTYAFTVMLATVLAGIALGSYLITPLMRRRFDWLQMLAALQIAAAFAALQSFVPLRRAPRVPGWLEPLFAGTPIHDVLPAALASVLAILPTAICFGLAFPIGLRLWAGASGDDRRTAERIGLFYSANVCGGILGSIAAGFLLLPALMSRGSLITIASLFLLSGLAIQAALLRRRPVLSLVTAAAAVGFVALVSEVPRSSASSRFRGGTPVLFHEEGAQTTVTVAGTGGTGDRVMYLDGRHQANDSPDMVFIHRRIGLLPAMLHPNPRRALVVGLGGGVTAGALSQYPGLAVDVIELSSGVVRGSDQFRHVNFDVLRQPNVRIRVDDGRNYLLRTRTAYDIITADAIIPNHAGANNLYSTEYFSLVRNALAPGGIALHWNGGSTDSEYRLILGAFVKAFPQTTLWGDGKLLVGWKDTPAPSLARLEAMLNDPAMRRLLSLMHVEKYDHLARMFRANPEQVHRLVADGPYLTDDKPLIEYFASLPPASPVDFPQGDIRSILRP
jgi:spermidine synthase